ncbi:hypothetical protein [Glacieibacterium frigidum]|uniref:Uncharacterized protein n=1 Tax=Glacieibacterium frigidum TaxID=2593303 RepID=A0A552U8I9_9SPHN|nr:hypothetical protein [Glacieibacterium frigidum]TRW14532.1 hypothetical protein FMM06_12580 [Glacieibacterium frigidum]
MRMMPVMLLGVVLGGCATYDPIVSLDQCNHTPGCVTSNPTPASGPPHARAVAPAGPGHQSRD